MLRSVKIGFSCKEECTRYVVRQQMAMRAKLKDGKLVW